MQKIALLFTITHFAKAIEKIFLLLNVFDNLYSPIQKIVNTAVEQLYIKRDDLIDPYVSGNKWRKLKYLVHKAKTENKNHLVTFGGAFSNHLVATAALCSKLQLKSTGFVRGEVVNNEMLTICKLYGMQLIFVDRDCYKNKMALYEAHFKNDSNTLFIDEGGASLEATLGCAEIIAELDQTYDHIFVAAGTGTTAAGLLAGLYQHQLQTKLHVIPVLKGATFIEQEINKYTPIRGQLCIHTDYHFGGYAKTNNELITYMKAFVAHTGILIDPVYTAKMFYAIEDLYQKETFKKEDKILAIHTGGLLGLLGMKDKF